MVTKEKEFTCNDIEVYKNKKAKKLLISTSIAFCTLVFIYSFLICKFISTLNLLIA